MKRQRKEGVSVARCEESNFKWWSLVRLVERHGSESRASRSSPWAAVTGFLCDGFRWLVSSGFSHCFKISLISSLGFLEVVGSHSSSRSAMRVTLLLLSSLITAYTFLSFHNAFKFFFQLKMLKGIFAF